LFLFFAYIEYLKSVANIQNVFYLCKFFLKIILK
jgi:hypothetical protein